MMKKKAFDKIVASFDEIYDLDSDESKTKISRSIAIYMIYKEKVYK